MIEQSTNKNIAIPEKDIANFCRKHYIRWFALFGSVLREDFGVNSDIDVLVEFEPGHIPGFIALGRMEEELSKLFNGRKVDLLTKEFLNWRIREKIIGEVVVKYAKR